LVGGGLRKRADVQSKNQKEKNLEGDSRRTITGDRKTTERTGTQPTRWNQRSRHKREEHEPEKKKAAPSKKRKKPQKAVRRNRTT